MRFSQVGWAGLFAHHFPAFIADSGTRSAWTRKEHYPAVQFPDHVCICAVDIFRCHFSFSGEQPARRY